MNKTYFVTSDVHSYATIMIEALIENGFEKDNPNHILIICGDLFDRGKEAVQLYKYVKYLYDKGRFVYIRGNHEDLLFECVKELKENDGCAQSYHYSNGTVNTATQLMQENILDEVLEFIDKVSVDYFEIAKYVFVHGWIPVDIDDWRNASTKDWEEARWLNGMDAWCRKRRLDDKTIVCGHFHTGWGHYHIHYQGFSQYDDFDIFEDLGIIALDACTAYSNKVNILKIEK